MTTEFYGASKDHFDGFDNPVRSLAWGVTIFSKRLLLLREELEKMEKDAKDCADGLLAMQKSSFKIPSDERMATAIQDSIETTPERIGFLPLKGMPQQ